MTPDPSKLLLLDIFHLTAVMLVLGLLAYALIRNSNPLIRWNEHGNVWTAPFQKVDLLVMAIIIGSYYALIWYSIFKSENTGLVLTDAQMLGAILSQFVSMTVLIGGIIFVLAYARRVDIIELFGLTRLPISKIILWSIGMLAITFPLLVGIALGWNYLLEQALGTKPAQQELVTVMQESTSVSLKLLIAFSASIVAPITEEILFRGYFYPALKRHSERFFAAVVISLLFAVVHANTASILPLFVLAMSFTIAYELTGCLLVPIAMHAIFNTSQVILMFAPVPNG